MENNFLRLGTAGLRGFIGKGLNPQVAVDYSSALGTYLDSGTVVVGSDTRESSPLLKHSAISALLACGSDVKDAEIIPAPLMHFLVKYYEISGGVLIGAGHHQAGWNAVVPLNNKGSYFNNVQTESLLAIYHSRLYQKVSYNSIGKVSRVSRSCIDAYLKKIASGLNLDAIRRSGFKVVVDFCNGSGSILAEKFAQLLELEIIPINKELHGFLPHDPEPRPRTGRQVKALIAPLNADVGFVLNSDASRVSVVTNQGETPSEEFTYALVANHVLAKFKSQSVLVTNICSTRMLDVIVDKFGALIEKTSVGQAPIVERMLELKAKLAGDGSGSVAFANGINGYDGFMVMGQILEAMAESETSSSGLLKQLPSYSIIKRSVPCHSFPYRMLVELKKFFNDADACDETDGLRFDWDFGWVHLRVSDTEPVLRVIAEAKDREVAEDLVSRALAFVERQNLL